MKNFKSIIDSIERDLAGFYGFPIVASAYDHLASYEELSASLGPAVNETAEFSSRGGVWFVADADELFIGIHFASEIIEAVEKDSPLDALTDLNLDPFCVLVEEISHFHMLLNRITSNQNVSKLDLEWQGEIDKVLISAIMLKRQCGHSHILPLTRKIFDLATINAEDEKLYWNASRRAARFWYEIISETPSSLLGSTKLRRALKKGYYCTQLAAA